MGLRAWLGLSGREAHSRVTMIASVDEFVAGETYDIPVPLADRFIVRGYANGSLSREFSADERAALKANAQVVSV